jgi:hypothetical protein
LDSGNKWRFTDHKWALCALPHCAERGTGCGSTITAHHHQLCAATNADANEHANEHTTDNTDGDSDSDSNAGDEYANADGKRDGECKPNTDHNLHTGWWDKLCLFTDDSAVAL